MLPRRPSPANDPRATLFASFPYFAVQFFAAFTHHVPIIQPLPKSVGSRSRNRSPPQNRSMLTMVLRAQKNADPPDLSAQTHQRPVNIDESDFADPKLAGRVRGRPGFGPCARCEGSVRQWISSWPVLLSPCERLAPLTPMSSAKNFSRQGRHHRQRRFSRTATA